MNRRAFLTALGLAPAVAKAVPASAVESGSLVAGHEAATRRLKQTLRQLMAVSDHAFSHINDDVPYPDFRDEPLEGCE